MNQLQLRRRKTFWTIVLIAIGISMFYAFMVDGLGDIFPYINTFIIGLVIGILYAYFEVYLYKNNIRKLKFLYILLIRTFYYIFVIASVMFTELVIARMIKYHLTFNEVLLSQEFQHYVFEEDFFYGIAYAFGLALVLNWALQMSRKLGKGMMLNFITGKYRHPVEQYRIFMFIKLKNTSAIIDKLGRLKFHEFLNELIYEISESLTAYKGEIYEYVDDQIIVNWKLNNGIPGANCIQSFFSSKNNLSAKKEKYQAKYGVVPDIKAGLHCGKVTHGEMGALKTEIVYSGDVMNTTSRILYQCIDSKNDLLVSKNLLDKIQLADNMDVEDFGLTSLKGKFEKMQLYSVFNTIISS